MMNKIVWPIEFDYFPANVTIPNPLGTIELNQFTESVGNPKPEIRTVFERIKKADIKERSELKKHIHYFTPAVKLDGNGRGYKNITGFTGILPLDFDKIDNPKIFRDYLIEKYEFIFASWLSASGNGVRAFVSIQTCSSVLEYKSIYWGLANEFMKYQGFDTATQNCVLPLFLSYDPEIKVKDITQLWTKTGKNPNDIKKPSAPYKVHAEFNGKYHEWSVKNTEKAVNGIKENGHPQLRGAAFALGGYVGAGYIDYHQAEALIHSLIASNSYLSKGVKGYQKTASTMIAKGILTPLYFDR